MTYNSNQNLHILSVKINERIKIDFYHLICIGKAGVLKCTSNIIIQYHCNTYNCATLLSIKDSIPILALIPSKRLHNITITTYGNGHESYIAWLLIRSKDLHLMLLLLSYLFVCHLRFKGCGDVYRYVLNESSPACTL